jgi:hypothetical protein
MASSSIPGSFSYEASDNAVEYLPAKKLDEIVDDFRVDQFPNFKTARSSDASSVRKNVMQDNSSQYLLVINRIKQGLQKCGLFKCIDDCGIHGNQLESATIVRDTPTFERNSVYLSPFEIEVPITVNGITRIEKRRQVLFALCDLQEKQLKDARWILFPHLAYKPGVPFPPGIVDGRAYILDVDNPSLIAQSLHNSISRLSQPVSIENDANSDAIVVNDPLPVELPLLPTDYLMKPGESTAEWWK